MVDAIFECTLFPEKHSLEVISFGSGEGIYLGSPYFGAPILNGTELSVKKLLVLDLNVLSDLRSGKNKENIKGLLAWAALNKAEVTPLVALSEQQRSHANPRFAYDEYLRALKEEYGVSISKVEENYNYEVISRLSPSIEANTTLWRNYLLIIKKFYHSKAGFKRKVGEFISYLQDNDLPIFTFGLYLGCSYFHVKENSSLYEGALVSKIKSDMDVHGKKHEDRLMNVASDMALIQSSAELFYIKDTREYNVAFIASKDVTVPHALSEFCWAQMKVNSQGNFGSMGFRPASKAGPDIFRVLSPYVAGLQDRSQDSSAIAARKENLKVIGETLLSQFPGS